MRSLLHLTFVVISVLLLLSVSVAARPQQAYSNFPVGDPAIVLHITQLEQDWVTAIVNKDTEVLNRLMADDFMGISPNGERYTKPEAIGDVQKGAYAVERMDIDNINVRVFGDVAVVTMNQDETSKFGDQISSGQYYFTNVWVYRYDRWQAVASQGTFVEWP